MKIKSDLQLLIELRDMVAARVMGQKTSKKYWEMMSKKSKKDTQEKVDAINKIALNEQLISADSKYLKIIDEMLEEQHGNN
jgi:hypothetical protein